MPKKYYKAEEIINILRQIEILVRQGQVRKWLYELGIKTLFIEPGSPWENGYIESFNGKLRDELLNREFF